MQGLTIYLFRHGDTAWSPERRLAGRTDLPLTEQGEQSARQLGERLRGARFDHVLVSPLVRARRTAELAGFGAVAERDDRLIEIDFGRYEGLTVADVRRDRPGWAYLREGSPDGEGPAELGARADAFLRDLAERTGTVALFAHSVLLRVLTARYLGLPVEAARNLLLAPASVAILAHDEVEGVPVIAAWNDRRHLTDQGGFF